MPSCKSYSLPLATNALLNPFLQVKFCNSERLFIISFYRCTMHLDITNVFRLATDTLFINPRKL
jgi:hypothetical protein